jgi:outer membrane receptor protein involved in Fe transport
LEAWQLTGGLRLDLNSETAAALSPRAVLVYRASRIHALRLGYGLAFRKPSFLERQMHIGIDDFNPAFPEIVDKFEYEFGNENLVNEKVHSFEAGWRAGFLNDQLRIAADLFFNIYQDMISLKIELRERMGAPDIANSTFKFLNSDSDVMVAGGEVELIWRPAENLAFWANLGLRRIVKKDADEHLPDEPLLRVNLGGRFNLVKGLFTDLALHYVSSYEQPILDPQDPLQTSLLASAGNNLLLIGRLGYRWIRDKSTLEAGLTIRTPLGATFRESGSFPSAVPNETTSDSGAEELVRLASFYLRGSF